MTKQETLKLSQKIHLFEEAVRAKDYGAGEEHFLDVLSVIEAGREGFGGTALKCTEQSEREATRFCASITTMFLDADYKLSERAFLRFSRFKRAISQAFEVSGYRDTGHFMTMMGKATPQGGRSLARYETLKLLVILSVNRMSAELVNLLLKQDRRLGLQLVTGFLSEQLTYSKDAENARSAIFNNAKIWEGVEFTNTMVRNMGPAYMGCSYAEAANKHDIKRTFNDVARRWMQHIEVSDTEFKVPRLATKKRPTLLIIAELYHSNHAMHRCYGPSIRALKEKFKLVLMTLDGNCDENLKELFDKIDPIAFDYNQPKAYFDRAKSYRPDMVYFPSVGMRLSSILASNVRFAPIQFMTFGHPATTHSPAIDYAIMGEGQVGDPATINEKILCHLSEPRFVMRPDAIEYATEVRKNPSTIRVAVPAWSRKVTPRFLRMCIELTKKSPKPLEFWFFPNAAGVLFQACKRRIESVLPGKVLPRTSYNDYMSNLSQCDIFLSSFPFGATNGIVDAACLGLPIVNLTGPEMHAANDGDLVSYMDAPSWLTTKSVDEYMAAVLRLIEDDDLRVGISQEMLDSNAASRLLLPEDSVFDSFGQVVETAYLCHEKIQGNSKHVWQYDELLALKDARD